MTAAFYLGCVAAESLSFLQGAIAAVCDILHTNTHAAAFARRLLRWWGSRWQVRLNRQGSGQQGGIISW